MKVDSKNKVPQSAPSKSNAEDTIRQQIQRSLHSTRAIATNSDVEISRATPPRHATHDHQAAASDSASRHPTATIEEIKQEAANGSTTKLKLALQRAYPAERPYVQDFTHLISELTTRMVTSVPEEMKHVNPQDIVIHLVDKPSVNAFVVSSDTGRFSIFIHRGLIEEFLAAPEFRERNMCIDALAGVVAHEICHTNFKRNYSGKDNSMVQEEYCDLLPAKMLERIGFRPEAMSLLCDLFERTRREPGARKVAADEPHATPQIRKEVFEKGAWKEYERARRKERLDGASSIDTLRTGWHDRLQSIVDSSKDHRIISFVEHELTKRDFKNLPVSEQLTLIKDVFNEHSELFTEWRLPGALQELTSVVTETLRRAGDEAVEFAQHPCLLKLSTVYYNYEQEMGYSLYASVASALNMPNFGAFMGVDHAYTTFLKATTKDEVVAALTQCEETCSGFTYPELQRWYWGPRLFPYAREYICNIFTPEDFASLREGNTIAFPFAPHRDLKEALANTLRTQIQYDGSTAKTYNLLRTLSGCAGIDQACHQLLHRKRPSYDERTDLNPAYALQTGTSCGTLEAFDISEERGITLLYPPRVPYPPEGITEALRQGELNYARFLTSRGASLLQEASKLTHDQFFDFVQKNGHLIMPQLHPVGILSEAQTRDSHQLAVAVVARLAHLMTDEPSDTFRQYAKRFRTDFTPMTSSPTWDVYRDYHASISNGTKGARIDPTHPLARYILENPDGHLTNSEQLTSIASLNYLQGSRYHLRLTGHELRKAFDHAVGGETRLNSLFKADYNSPPHIFITNLTRLHEAGSIIYNNGYDIHPHIPVREIRTQLIRRYLEATPHDLFSLEQLHTLYDLCSGGDSKTTARYITTIATDLMSKRDLSALTNTEFIASYHHLVCMGATDRSVQLETTCNQEIMRRYKILPSQSARTVFLDEIIYPKAFSCGDANIVGSVLSGFTPSQKYRFKNLEYVSSVYIPRTTEPSFERFIITSSVDATTSAIRAATNRRHDDKSPEFLLQCRAILAKFDQQKLPTGIRARILQGVADELLLQREASFFFRDNLNAHSKYQSRLTFSDCMTATHQQGSLTNLGATQAHNGLVELRGAAQKPLRDTLFRFFMNRSPEGEIRSLTELLVNQLKGHDEFENGNYPRVFEALGIVGVSGFSDSAGRTQQEELVEHHLRGLHQRFSELDVQAKGAALSVLAVDNAPTADAFSTFQEEVLLPHILPKHGPYNELLLSGINDYFDFYSNALHHKYMVACGILAASQDQASNVSELAKVGLIAKNFLGAHGTAGYKLLQRIRNHPSTPQDIKDVLHNVLDETISLPRWTIHERIEEFGPRGATQHWIGRAKAGSMCLSVPMKKNDGSESFLSLIHPGSHVDSLYWLQNFTTMAAHLAELDPRLGVLAPMAQQTRHLIKNETDFASSPEPQQRIAERAYTYSMNFPRDRITVTSSCAPLISAEAKPHPTDFMLNSANKEAGRVIGETLLEMVSEFREKIKNDEWSKEQAEKRFTVLQSAAFSVLANEVRLIASCQGKDHDRHPGNYLIEVQEDKSTGHSTIHLNHFDFGCTDVQEPSEDVRKELAATLTRFVNTSGVVESLVRPNKVVDRLSLSLFEKGTFVPEIASIPLGLLAATGANEKVRINGKERRLLSGSDMLRAVKVGLESARVPAELASTVPGGLKGWLLRKAYQRVDTREITLEA